MPPRLPGPAVTAFDGRPSHPVIYLHGFASSPKSTKVAYFRERFREHGIDVRCPDLNQPTFATLTMTRMLDSSVPSWTRRRRPAMLIGSSLGGTLAVLAAAQFPARRSARVAGAGGDVRQARASPAAARAHRGMASPRRAAVLPLRVRRERELSFTFYEDSLRYDAFDAPICAADADLPGPARRVGGSPHRWRRSRGARRTSRCRCSTTTTS